MVVMMEAMAANLSTGRHKGVEVCRWVRGYGGSTRATVIAGRAVEDRDPNQSAVDGKIANRNAAGRPTQRRHVENLLTVTTA